MGSADATGILALMSDTNSQTKHLVRTSQLGPGDAVAISHPYNDDSELYLTRLSDPTGLTHLGISLARVPPGRESFALHAHTIQEEWIYVVSGRGHVRLDDKEVPIEAGDFLGFPAGGPAHLVRNTSDADLVYLQGGDRREGDRGWFPELGKIVYHHDQGHVAMIDEAHIQRLPFTAWLAKR